MGTQASFALGSAGHPTLLTTVHMLQSAPCLAVGLLDSQPLRNCVPGIRMMGRNCLQSHGILDLVSLELPSVSGARLMGHPLRLRHPTVFTIGRTRSSLARWITVQLWSWQIKLMLVLLEGTDILPLDIGTSQQHTAHSPLAALFFLLEWLIRNGWEFYI